MLPFATLGKVALSPLATLGKVALSQYLFQDIYNSVLLKLSKIHWVKAFPQLFFDLFQNQSM